MLCKENFALVEVQAHNSLKAFICSMWWLQINILFFFPSLYSVFLKHCFSGSWGVGGDGDRAQLWFVGVSPVHT